MILNKHIILFILLVSILIGQNAIAQKLDKFDKLINETRNEIYGNPDKVIKTGEYIIENSGNNIDIKIKANKLISDGYSSKRDYQKSLKYLLKAIDLLPQSTNELLKLSIETKAGIQYQQLKIFDKAIQYLDNAENMCLKYKDKDSTTLFLGINYIVRGFIYKEKLNCEIAISFFDKGILELKKGKNILEVANAISIAKYNKGNCFILVGNYENAIESFNESIIYAKKIKANSLQAFAQKGLAQVKTIQGDYKQAIAILNEAHAISKDVNDLVLNQELFNELSENYLALNDWEKHQIFQKKYLETQYKIKNNERNSISNLIDEKENNFKLLEDRNFTNFWIYGIIFLALSILIITIFLNKKMNVKIKEYKQIIEKIQLEN